MKVINTIQTVMAHGGVLDDMPTEPTRKDIEQAIIFLLQNGISTYNNNLKVKSGCGPVRDFYFAEVPVSLVKYVRKIRGFIDVDDYPSPCFALPQEIGAIGNARIILSKKKNVLNIRSRNDKPIYGIVFSNDLKSKGQLVLACTIKE